MTAREQPRKLGAFAMSRNSIFPGAIRGQPPTAFRHDIPAKMRLTQMTELRGDTCFAVIREISEFAQCQPTGICGEASRVPHSHVRLLRDLFRTLGCGKHYVAHHFHLRQDSLAVLQKISRWFACRCTHRNSFALGPKRFIIVLAENPFAISGL
jgi:hypothetical protein